MFLYLSNDGLLAFNLYDKHHSLTILKCNHLEHQPFSAEKINLHSLLTGVCHVTLGLSAAHKLIALNFKDFISQQFHWKLLSYLPYFCKFLFTVVASFQFL